MTDSELRRGCKSLKMEELGNEGKQQKYFSEQEWESPVNFGRDSLETSKKNTFPPREKDDVAGRI